MSTKPFHEYNPFIQRLLKRFPSIRPRQPKSTSPNVAFKEALYALIKEFQEACRASKESDDINYQFIQAKGRELIADPSNEFTQKNTPDLS